MRKLLLAVLLALSSSLSFSATISDYSLDAEQGIVTNTETGLQWLRWDLTADKSVAWFQTSEEGRALRDSGWTLAESGQMVELLEDFRFLGPGGPADNLSRQTIGFRTDRPEWIYPFAQFIELFGVTYKPTDGFVVSRAIFSASPYQPRYSMTEVSTHEQSPDGTYSVYAAINHIRAYSETNADKEGLALIRVADVPLPGALALFSFSLAGLLLRKAR